MFPLISDAIEDLGLDLSKVVDLGFDSAANMSGGNEGVVTRFKDVSPCAVNIHCYGHLLNLAVKDCLSSVPLLSSENTFVRTLKSLSATRWSTLYESVKAFDEEFERIIKCLWQVMQECDAKASAGAKSWIFQTNFNAISR